MKKIMTIKKNDRLIIDITGTTSEGYGVGKSDEGIAIFVPNSAVGDRVDVLIVKVLKRYCFGKVMEIIKPSEYRQEVDCKVFLKCGGCCYRHITYDAELKIKEQKVKDAIARIAGLNVKINPIVGADVPDNYRNKAQFPLAKNKDGNVEMGFYGFHSHRVVDADTCLLQPKIFDKVMAVVKDYLQTTNETIYDETTHKGLVRHLYVRYGEKTGEVMVCLVINGDKLKNETLLVNSLKENIPNLKSVVINSNKEKTNVITGTKNRAIYGDTYIIDNLCGLNFRISPNSFYQVNHSQAEKLYNKAKEYANLTGKENLIDLYCGTGTIGLTMANECKSLIGVEIVPQAIKDAKLNAKLNNINNAQFICGDATKCGEKLKNDNISPDVVVVDPPRKGCDSKLLETMVKMAPKRIVYVSCDPATLARDLKVLSEQGYEVEKVCAVDQFSHSSHVETVVLLQRKNM